jgi:hypothetical protein
MVVVLAVGPGLGACATEQGHGPVARMSIEPKYVPANTPTEVSLDGRRSCDELDHPQGCDKSADGSGPTSACPGGVTFAWSVDGKVEIVSGSLDGPSLKIRVSTDRPIGVTLKVVDCAGDSGEIHGQIGVILPWADGATTIAPDGGI